MTKPAFLVTAALLGAVFVPAHAQNAPGAPRTGALTTPVAAPISTSLETLLPLQSGQINRLNRLYDAYASRRAPDVDIINKEHFQLAPASTLPTLDERRDEQPERDIRAARRRVAADLRATRAHALEVLTPLQRAQLEAFAGDPRFQLRADTFHHLFLLPVDEVEQLPLINPNPREWTEGAPKRRRVRGTGNYGVYGGYAGGQPQYGVYGGYGQGAVGIHGGIGRGGPSFGVNIGGVFARIR